MDLKVTKLGPNDPPECISLILDQVPPHGSYQGPARLFSSKKEPFEKDVICLDASSA